MSGIKNALIALGTQFVLFMFAASASYAQSQSSAQAEQALRQIESEVSAAYTQGDTTTLDHIWADEYTFTPPNGIVISKADYLAMLKSGAVKYESFKDRK